MSYRADMTDMKTEIEVEMRVEMRNEMRIDTMLAVMNKQKAKM
jgi:hypothetical protein